MKSLITASLLLIYLPAYASRCDVFVGKWMGQCKPVHKSGTESLNNSYSFETEISKIGECEGLKFLGEAINFNKVNNTEIKKSDVVRTRQSVLRWLKPSSQPSIEIFNSTIDITYAPVTNEIVKTASWKNSYTLTSISASEMSFLVKFQENFTSVDADHCEMRQQK